MELGDSWAIWVRPTSRSRRSGIAASSASKVRALAKKEDVVPVGLSERATREGAGAPKAVQQHARCQATGSSSSSVGAGALRRAAGFGQTAFEIAADILAALLAGLAGLAIRR